MFFIYILKNRENEIYIGQTNNLHQRLIRYNSNQCRSTKNRGPRKIAYKEKFDTRAEAMRREKNLKSEQGREWIKSTI